MGAEAEEIAERVLGGGTFSVKKFVECFPVLVEAAGGTEKLRQMALDLAIRGTILPRTKDVDSASMLAQFLPRAVLQETPSTDLPFGIPTAWTWCFLGNLCSDVHYGYTASARPVLRKTRLLRITDIQNDRVDWDSVPGCEIEPAKVPQYLLRHGDLLIARTGGTIGKTYLVQNPTVQAVFASYLIRAAPLSPDISAYLKLFAGTSFYWRQLYAGAAGTGQPNVNATTLKALLLPLPPLAEQKRIVARVDQLMALIDQLEAKQNRRRDLGARFTQASLEALTTAESPQEFTTAWTRIHSNWPTLLDQPDKVADVRRAILKIGVQGRLVPQIEADEPAATLLARIGVQPASPDVDNVGGEFPQGWERVQIGQLAVVKSGATLAPELECASGDWPYLKIADMNLPGNEKEAVLSSRYVRKSDDLRRYLIDPGSIIFPKRGGAIATNKKRMVRQPILVDLNTMAITCPSEMCFEYVYLWFLTIDLAELDNGTSVPQINHKDISPLILPVPPHAEQKRIVAKVEHLMKLCDALEAALRRREDRAAKLTEAVVQEMVA